MAIRRNVRFEDVFPNFKHVGPHDVDTLHVETAFRSVCEYRDQRAHKTFLALVDGLAQADKVDLAEQWLNIYELEALC